MTKNITDIKIRNIVFNISNGILFYLIILLYAYCFTYCIPWENFHIFTDIENYLARIINLANEGEEREVRE